MAFLQSIGRWLGLGGALAENTGQQVSAPSAPLVGDTYAVGADGALQISTVWSCVDLRASTLASLPFFAYLTSSGQKQLARNTRLYALLHDSPNARMTPFEFWRAMILNHDLRGNAYARLDRAPDGEVVAMWPMPADQVQPFMLDNGEMLYEYRIGANVAILAADNVLHLKNLGNGNMGLSKLDFMRGTTTEAERMQTSASKLFGSGGKPTGVLMIDAVLNKEQRTAVKANFAEMADGSNSRLYLLEANMKYQQVSMTAEDQQLMESRKFSVEEICRWFGVPPVLVHHSNVTTWGTGIEQIVDGWFKLGVRPMLVSVEQAVRKRVLTPRQRASMTAEISFDALYRANIKDRFEVYQKGVQGGILKLNEARQLENLPPVGEEGDQLLVQTNLIQLSKLGQQPAAPTAPIKDPTGANHAAA